jgi:general secretion pathway protein D
MMEDEMNRRNPAPASAGITASKTVFAFVLIAAMPGFVVAQTASDAQAPASASAGATLAVNTPKDAVNSGASFQVPVTLTNGTDVDSVTLIFQYDTTKLSLQSISPGDFLNRDGEQPRLVHSDSPMGHVVISMSRPPGAGGINGDGTVCLLNFEAVNSGTTDLTITRATLVNSAQQVTRAKFVQPSISVK